VVPAHAHLHGDGNGDGLHGLFHQLRSERHLAHQRGTREAIGNLANWAAEVDVDDRGAPIFAQPRSLRH
jgi:hypothetical protein